MQAIHQANSDKLDECLSTMRTIIGIQAKSTLWTFYSNARIVWKALDNEMVECRKRRRITQKYAELQVEFNECVNTYDQWRVMAALSC
jgi:hypothetical protein